MMFCRFLHVGNLTRRKNKHRKQNPDFKTFMNLFNCANLNCLSSFSKLFIIKLGYRKMFSDEKTKNINTFY